MERTLSGFWGPQVQTGPSQFWDGPQKVTFFFLLYSFSFLVRHIGPLIKNSGPNPMSFQFLVEGTLGPPCTSDPYLRKSWLRHCYSFSSVSQPKIWSSWSEPTLRSFSRHENKTSASHARLCYVRTALVRAMERIVPSPESRPAAVCSGWPAGDRRGARSTGRRGARSRSHCPRPGATSTCGTGRAPPMTMTMSIWLCQSVGIHWTFIVYKRCHDDGGNRGYFERVQSSP